MKKESKISFNNILPIFLVFMCGAIAQLIMGIIDDVMLVLELFIWFALFIFAFFIYEISQRWLE